MDMPERTGERRLLVLHGRSLEHSSLLPFLREQFEVVETQDLDEALEAMRSDAVDAVLAETADFLPLERGVARQRAATVLDTLGDGVGIVGGRGELVWANRRLRELSEGVREQFRRLCLRAYEDLATNPPPAGGNGRRYSLIPGNGRYYEVICSPVCDGEGVLRQVAAVIADATTQRRQQRKLNAIERAGRELVRIDRDAVQQRDAAERMRLLEERVISCSREVLHYEHFSVLLLDRDTNRLEPLIFEGLDDRAIRQGIFANTEGNGISGYVAATGTSYICPDVAADAHYLPGLDGARSSLTVPLRLEDEVIGVLNVESSSPAAFDEEDRQFAEIFGNYVALALHVLNLLVAQRRATHTQISGSICQEVSGPLNDVITAAGELRDDYIGHDDLRRRLRELIDAATRARDAVRGIEQSCDTGVVPQAPRAAEADPVLAGARVLVADDEPLIRETARDVLQRRGCTVDVAEHGAAALERLAGAHYDLVISDIRMPGASGYEVFAAAKAADANTAVLLITAFGYDPGHSVVRARQDGLSGVLLKPFKVDQLVSECRKALRSRTRS